jgi:small subunit ribosomal protein S1
MTDDASKKVAADESSSDPASSNCESAENKTDTPLQSSNPLAADSAAEPAATTSDSKAEQTAATQENKIETTAAVRQIKIGSQRDQPSGKAELQAKPQQITPGVNTTTIETSDILPEATKKAARSKNNPPPQLDTEITPELQKEFDAALSETAIDELLLSAAASAGEELAEGDKFKGRVLSVGDEHLVVDLERRNQGIVPVKQFHDTPAVGTMIDVVVSRFDSAEGVYELVAPGAAVDVAGWNEIAQGMVVDAVVTGHNKGGLEIEVNRLRGFIPASQIALYRVNQFDEFVGQKFSCVVTEVNPKRRNLVLSRRAILERDRAEAKQKILAELEVGQIREGIVTRLQPFGAFVDLGGIDGLIHISNLSWDRIGHPSEVVKEGQKISVKVSRIDSQTGKIGLTYRDTFENPWHTAADSYRAHARVKGTVTRLTDFGAFVRLETGIEGLLHVSEISHQRVRRPSDTLSKGQELELQVLTIDPEAQRISLSLKALEAPPEQQQKGGSENREKEKTSSTSRQPSDLKGGTDRASGGEQFGLKW